MIYLLGGNGFIGSAFTNFLKKHDKDFKTITRENYELFKGTECSIFINANGNSKKYLAENEPKIDFRQSVVSVLDSLADFQFKKYIYLSSSDVYPVNSSLQNSCEDFNFYGSIKSNYGFHKYLSELCVKKYSVNWLTFRLGGFVGKGLKKNAIFDIINKKKLWVHPESKFQFMDTEECAQIVVELAETSVANEVFNLTAKGSISIREIQNLAGVNLDYDSYLEPRNYEICTCKIEKYTSLPSTLSTVQNYLSKIL